MADFIDGTVTLPAYVAETDIIEAESGRVEGQTSLLVTSAEQKAQVTLHRTH